ncbi:BglG family transcription antiterminator [Clostridium sp. Marseille-P3244]|uniref:BglG family transcription antiterminator n=1 Tax=Clostridium sp. Marseille-P3244 TaxID=1871020 RepID=UPI0009F88475|nr:PTS sugar transporter subunit IIA [Clostridium sp. Marseille-P3244]
MNERQCNILTMLETGQELNVETLMDQFAVTERTIRNDIRDLNSELPEGTKVNIVDGGRISVSTKDDFSSIVARLADQSDYYHYRLSARERRTILTLILLYSSHYVTMAELADKLFVSKNTIVSETENLKEIFERHGLRLESKTRRGFRTVGDEKKIRRFIFELCRDNTGDNNSSAYRRLFRRELEGNIDRKAVFDILCVWENRHGFELTDQSFEELENYLIVTANRISSGNILLESYDGNMTDLSEASELLQMVLTKIGKNSEAILSAELPALNRRILGCRYIKKNFSNKKIDSLYTEMRILTFIYDICRRLDIAQEINYDKFYFIFVHINSAVQRVRQGEEVIENAFQEELEVSYPDIFSVIRQEAETLDELVPGNMGDMELSYIAMYFIAVLAEKPERDREIRAVLVCSSGMCTAMLLQAKLKLHFNIEIVDVLSSHKYEQYDLTEVDLIISTVYVETKTCPAACISPLLSDSDIETIHSAIAQIRHEQKHQDESSLQRQIREYIDEYRSLTQSLGEGQDPYGRTVEEFYHKYFGADSTDSEKNLYSLLDEDFILLDEDVSTWEEAVTCAGKLLTDKGVAEPRYIDSMIRIIRNNGPYCVFIPHVALAHAAPEDGGEKMGLSLVRLKRPVEFHHPSNDPVQIVVCLSGGKDKDYLQPFFHLVRIFQNREVLEFILSAVHPTEIINIIRFYEQYFFT